MKSSRFLQLVDDEFGADFAQVLMADIALDALGDRSANRALIEGEDAELVWRAICQQFAVPKERWAGTSSKNMTLGDDSTRR